MPFIQKSVNSSKPHIAFENLLNSFARYENRIAIIEKDGREFTYDDLKKRIVGARAELVKRGVKKNSKVLVFVPMSIELYSILEGLFSIGATAVFLDPWMKGKKMSQVIRQVKPDLFVATKKINRLAWLLPSTWFLKRWIVTQITPRDGTWEIATVADGDNALITFTSGTTGKPKGANRTFAFLHAQEKALASHLKKESGHYIEYTNFPIVALADFAMGNTVVIPDLNLMKIHEASADPVISQLKNTGVNRIIVSPSLLNIIVKGLDKLPDVAEVVTGGAPISNTLLRKCVDQFPGIRFEAIYGSTESEPICVCSFNDIANQLEYPLKGVFVGKPVNDIRVKIIEAINAEIKTSQFEKIILPEGERGEIVVTGDHVNKTYYENPAAFARNKIVDKAGAIWHRTGDIGYFDNGEIYLVGRDHRIMNYNGKEIYPYPAEQFIEKEFDFTDVGYVQDRDGNFALWIGSTDQRDNIPLIAGMNHIGYPVDYVEMHSAPLPRDARHQSKLQTDYL